MIGQSLTEPFKDGLGKAFNVAENQQQSRRQVYQR